MVVVYLGMQVLILLLEGGPLELAVSVASLGFGLYALFAGTRSAIILTRLLLQAWRNRGAHAGKASDNPALRLPVVVFVCIEMLVFANLVVAPPYLLIPVAGEYTHYALNVCACCSASIGFLMSRYRSKGRVQLSRAWPL